MANGGKRPGAGRPALDPSKKAVPTTVLLTESDRATLERLAVRFRKSQSGVIRLALSILDAS